MLVQTWLKLLECWKFSSDHTHLMFLSDYICLKYKNILSSVSGEVVFDGRTKSIIGEEDEKKLSWVCRKQAPKNTWPSQRYLKSFKKVKSKIESTILHRKSPSHTCLCVCVCVRVCPYTLSFSILENILRFIFILSYAILRPSETKVEERIFDHKLLKSCWETCEERVRHGPVLQKLLRSWQFMVQSLRNGWGAGMYRSRPSVVLDGLAFYGPVP